MPSKVWDEIIYPFSNFNGCTVEVWEGISNYIPHFILGVITYLKGAPYHNSRISLSGGTFQIIAMATLVVIWCY